MSTILRSFFLGSLALTACCSYHPYNPDNDTAYLDYWCDPANQSSSIWSIFQQEESLFGTDNNPLEADSKEECLLNNGRLY